MSYTIGQMAARLGLECQGDSTRLLRKVAKREKADEEKKQKEFDEKAKRIEDLKKEIADREKELQGLRTTWMVYDRQTVFRLNQEIADLRKEIEDIQKEIAELK